MKTLKVNISSREYDIKIEKGLLADEIFLDRELNLIYFKQKIEDKIKNLKKF